MGDPESALQRARSRLDEKAYNIVFNNCEHFATWCADGRHSSEQVSKAGSAMGFAVGCGMIGGGAASVAAPGLWGLLGYTVVNPVLAGAVLFFGILATHKAVDEGQRRHGPAS